MLNSLSIFLLERTYLSNLSRIDLCVCESEREREKEKPLMIFSWFLFFLWSQSGFGEFYWNFFWRKVSECIPGNLPECGPLHTPVPPIYQPDPSGCSHYENVQHCFFPLHATLKSLQTSISMSFWPWICSSLPLALLKTPK